MCVAGEEHDAATIGAKTAEKSEDKGSMGDLDDLETLFVPILGDLCSPGQVPVIGVADNTGEWGKSVLCDLGGDAASEFVDGRKIGKIKLADRGLSARMLRNRRA